MVREITYNNTIIGIIISHRFQAEGAHFFTPDNFSQQLGYLNYPKGRLIKPHFHNRIDREVQYTQEVLIIKKGKLRVDFYNDDCKYIESAILQSDDVILLASGGHGFEILEDIEIIEVKQGCYSGEKDKTIFEGINNRNCVIK